MESCELILNNDYEVKSIVPLYKEKEEKGIVSITRYEFKDDLLFNLRVMRDGGDLFVMKPGHYCRLTINKELVMSDTFLERKSNREFIRKANGRVLIAGLGLGLIIHNILHKQDITEIVVIEKHQDVIDLVSPKFNDSRLKIICDDIFNYLPKKEDKFDTIYFDIWTDITIENLDDIKLLHNKFKNKLNRENSRSWMNSWMKEYLQEAKRKENRRGW